MNTQLSTYDFNTNTIRVVDLDGEPWFVAADVANALQFKNVSTSMSHILSPLGSDEKMRAPKNLSLARQPLIISESGLYQLIMRSDKPEAREFQRWVTGTVLPAIRKDGGYIMGEEKVVTGEMDEDAFILKAVEILQGKVARLKAEKEAVEEEKEELAAHITQHRYTLFDFMSRIPGVNRNQTTKDLAREGILYRRNGHYAVRYKYLEHFDLKLNVTYNKTTITVKPKGAELIHKLLREGKLTMKKGHRN
jgi:prophage antirepressor-like protein